MKYKNRLVERKVKEYFEHFACVLVVGARQAGKSTLLDHLFGQTMKSFVFDPQQDLYGERSDPELFLRNNHPPVILDEIQYVPGLIAPLKRFVDEARHPGMYLITGSQQWEVIKNLSESLAGRIAIVELPPFAQEEAKSCPIMNWVPDWIKRVSRNGTEAGIPIDGMISAGLSPAQIIWAGAMPEVASLPEQMIPGWMRGYVSTYLQRDVRSLLKLHDESRFTKLLGLCSTLTAQEVNYSQLGRDIGQTAPTAHSWLEILKATYQWLELPSYSNNQIKKLSQKPKGHMTDTGLACYLQRISSPEALMGHPSFGSLFETFCITEIFKQLQKLPLMPALYHFRIHSGAEVDLVLEMDGYYFPIEIKSRSTVRQSDTRGIERFREIAGPRACPGAIIFSGRKTVNLNSHATAIPFDAISG